MSANPDLRPFFREMEKLVEAAPEGLTGEIARGLFAMSPRPRARHGTTQGRLFGALQAQYGESRSGADPEWLFVIEPEIRSEETFSRLVPDVAGWRRSGNGWPDLDVTPIELAPDWVAEVLSAGTEAYDRGAKKDAYGQMGVGWLWLLDSVKRRIETYSNVRGKMTGGPVLESEIPTTLHAEPFADLSYPLDGLFA